MPADRRTRGRSVWASCAKAAIANAAGARAVTADFMRGLSPKEMPAEAGIDSLVASRGLRLGFRSGGLLGLGLLGLLGGLLLGLRVHLVGLHGLAGCSGSSGL